MTRGRRNPLLALSALVLALAGPACTKSSPTAEDAKTEPAAAPAAAADDAQEEAAPAAAAPAAAGGEEITTTLPAPEIKLLDAGQEPRAPLRVKVEAGQRETMLMTMTMGMEMDMGGMGAMPKMAMPPIAMSMGIHVTSVSDTGDFRYEFSLDSVDVKARPSDPPEIAEAMKGAMAGMVGMSGSSVVSNRGEVREASFKLPPNALPQVKQTMDSMQQSIKQIAVPFPEEAVGIGAKWEVISAGAEINGITMTQKSSYEVLERDGDTLTLATTVNQDAEPQVMKAPGIPATATVYLEELESDGSGKSSFNLTHVSPVSGTMDLTSKMRMSVDAGGQKQAMKMNMDLGLEIEGK
ncbi:MAG: hypothetical protein KC486_23295 [Myxococcales bacterium]|nr:hypothetical protein [Myxococcales bacterium]